MEKVVYVLKSFVELYQISSYCFTKEDDLLICFEAGKSQDAILRDKVLYYNLKQNWMTEQRPIIVLEEPFIYYCVFGKGDKFFIFGPVSSETVRAVEKAKYQRNHGIKDKEYRIPKLHAEKIKKILNIVKAALDIWDDDWVILGQNESGFREEELQYYEYQKFQSNMGRMSYKEEREWFAAIREGNMELLSQNAVQYSGDDIGIMAQSSMKQIEYKVVTTITLATRAAIEGGVNPVKAYEKSDMYLQALERCTNVLKMEEIGGQAMMEFIRMVHDRKKKKGSGYIEQCKDYIAANYHKPIRVSNIAQAIGLNESYLCRKFKEIEDMTIQEYILKEKMKVAANMLKYSNAAIADISDYLCFHSQSYFTERFQKIYHVTPSHYRKQNKAIEFLEEDAGKVQN